ncbi:MAG: hypothetical protein BGO38_15945 [Cellulomonas sp. 73-145]|uniref:hypothetical protein n=1 Tax=Cellulomonas sp. 73-145 TaxID=1895739 RepID=UPI000928254C|nr:hypothetical protein [Cellulomonas sp. 73-145]MBN9327149.1 hypothetical protein [Cellulomonas sp.]OJV58838.1 MAG: hypothetical protein BGO38_15945 [Cellulomonas sp. 73-145]
MHPELFLLVHRQHERELEQLHARRAALAERLQLTARADAAPAVRAAAVPAAVTALVARLRTTTAPPVPAGGPECCPAF